MGINVYLTGGAGCNIGKKIKNSSVNKFFIDTSTSNLKNVDSDNVFLVDGLDGAGKFRATTYDKFKHYADDVLIRFKPSNELNIVISSLSGGSGSVLSPMIVKKLIEDGKNVIVFAIDSKNSVIEINNTIKTLMTYKSISDTIGRNINIVYFENNSRNDVDNECVWTVELLNLLVDKERTEEFDISDLSNFINYDKVTDNEPNVSFIELHANEAVVPVKNTIVTSTILLTKDHNTSILPVVPEYLATCIITNADKDFKTDIRIDNIVGALALRIEDLETMTKELSDNKKINKVKDITVKSDNADGMIL